MSKYISNEAYPGVDDKERAFPLTGYSPEEQYGMTLRDWFAGQVLTCIMNRNEIYLSEHKLEEIYRAVAQSAYGIADAMLKVRKESK